MERWSFIHAYLCRGRATLAIRTDGSLTVNVGVAFCSPKDQFSKAKGRMVAQARANCPSSAFRFVYELSSKEEFTGLKEKLTTLFYNMCISKTPKWPKWAKKGAQHEI